MLHNYLSVPVRREAHAIEDRSFLGRSPLIPCSVSTPDEGLAPRNLLNRSRFQIAFRCFWVSPKVVSREGKGRAMTWSDNP